jgi:fatty-acyl-CoA synthase
MAVSEPDSRAASAADPAPNHAALTPLSFLERAALAFADRTALIHGNRRFSYRELRARVHRLATALRRAGIQPGDRVAVLAPNGPAALEGHYGIPLAGAILVAINTRLSANEIRYILQHSAARLLIVDTELRPIVAPVLADCPDLQTVVAVEDSTIPAAPDLDYETFLATG